MNLAGTHPDPAANVVAGSPVYEKSAGVTGEEELACAGRML